MNLLYINEFYQDNIASRFSELNKAFCSGTYIQQGVILTSAHCVNRIDSAMLQQNLIKAIFHIGTKSHPIFVPIKKIQILLEKHSGDLAILFFDDQAFSQQLKALNLTHPKPITFLKDSIFPTSGDITIYGIGKAGFDFFCVGDKCDTGIRLFREDEDRGKDFIKLSLGEKLQLMSVNVDYYYRFAKTRLDEYPQSRTELINWLLSKGNEAISVDDIESTKTNEILAKYLVSVWLKDGTISNSSFDFVGSIRLPRASNDQALGVCSGDSGAPITIFDGKEEKLLGVTSSVLYSHSFATELVDISIDGKYNITGRDLVKFGYSILGLFCGDIIHFSHLGSIILSGVINHPIFQSDD